MYTAPDLHAVQLMIVRQVMPDSSHSSGASVTKLEPVNHCLGIATDRTG